MGSEVFLPEEVSTDHFFREKVVVYQKKKGYRFALDAPILADFLPFCGDAALEIGCGSGIVSLLALYRDKFPKVTGIEIQEDLSRLARRNAEANGLSRRFQVVHADFNEIYSAFQGIPLIFSNPPFAPLGRGRLSALTEVRLAKFELALSLSDILEKSRSILAPEGHLILIFPFLRYNELLAHAGRIGLFPSRTRLVKPFEHREPDRVLVQLGGKKVRPCEQEPLVVFREKGVYSDEMNRIFEGKGHD